MPVFTMCNTQDDNHTSVSLPVHMFAIFMLVFLITFISLFKGLLLKCSFWRTPQDKKCFDDQAYWEVINIIFLFCTISKNSCNDTLTHSKKKLY